MFIKGLPVWLKGKQNEMNLQARFGTVLEGHGTAVLRLAGATFYKVTLDGKTVHYGPAPCAKGYARVDEVGLCLSGASKLVIEAAGYNCYSYAAVKQPSFIRAEVILNGECIAATGYDFKGYLVCSRVQRSLRYSFQRHFSEVWDMEREDIPFELCKIEHQLTYLKRNAPLPDIELEAATALDKTEFKITDTDFVMPSLQGAVDDVGDIINGFELGQTEQNPLAQLACFDYRFEFNKDVTADINAHQAVLYGLQKDSCGLFSFDYKAKKGTRAYIVFDEKLKDGRFDHKSWECINVISVSLSGSGSFESFEIMGCKYFAVFVLEGGLELENVGFLKIRARVNEPELNCSDGVLQKIYAAAIESARCNSLAVFMDCPTRERAGWLCDSYFAAQASYALNENTLTEDDFVQNFLLADCPELPKGMLPMCYPSDHPNGNFIPQWAMWFVLQLDGYLKRNTDITVDMIKDTVIALLDYFRGFENELYLLEGLNGWNFVEWSRANMWVEGINFPTNMLYSKVLSIAGRWFDDAQMIKRSERIRQAVIKYSFDGRFFRDQAFIRDGKLVCEPHISEVCQYYAFYFGVADAAFQELKKRLVNDFTPHSNNGDIEKVNAFMGMYMRMDLLHVWGYDDILLNEIKEFFGRMADITGTLWEHKSLSCSLNHGFTAYIAVLLLNIFNK